MGFMKKFKRTNENSESVDEMLDETEQAPVTLPELAAPDGVGPALPEDDAGPSQQTGIAPDGIEKDSAGDDEDSPGGAADSILDDGLLTLFEEEEEQADPIVKDMLSDVDDVDMDELLSEILFLTEEVEILSGEA